MISSYGGASEAVIARIDSVWKKFRDLSSVLLGKLGYLWSNGGRFISVVFDQFCCTVVKCGKLLLWMRQGCMEWSVVWSGWYMGWTVDRVSTDVLSNRVGVVAKIEDMIIQSHLQWYVHVIHQDINSQIREVMELEITGKKNKSRPRNRGKSV